MSPHATPRLVAVGALGVLALVLVWNAWHFPWRQGYDATASAHYAEVLGDEHRLPHRDETDVWHNPPLFFVVAGALYRSAETIDVVQPGRVVQLFSALCVIGIAALTFALARELFPSRVWLAPLALLLAVLTPVLVRAGSLFHPEPLATLLTTAAFYVVVRSMRRERLGWGAGLLAGGLLGLANLTRTWALAALAAVLLGLALHWLWRREAAGVRALAGVAIAALALIAPWLAVKAATYGSPLAYSRPVAEQWRQHGRPASFWLDLSPVDVVQRPYQPWFRNVLVPTVYADWWGDYWRVWRVPPALHDEPDTLPSAYAGPLRRQSLAGLAASVAVLAGLAALAVARLAAPRCGDGDARALGRAAGGLLRRLSGAVPEAGRRQHQGALRAERGARAGRRGRVRAVVARRARPARRRARGAHGGRARRTDGAVRRPACVERPATVPAMRYVVTGAAGFIGSHLRDALEASGHDVVAVDSLTDYYEPARKLENVGGRDLVEVDLAETDVDALLEGVDGVYHLAGQPGVRASFGPDFDHYVRRNVVASARVFEAARARGVRVVFASSSSVYGDAEAYPTPESAVPRPISPYGVTKLAAEHLAYAHARTGGLEVVGLRYFTVYGPRQRPDMAFARLLEALASGEAFPLFGDGSASRSFTFVGDAVAATIAAMERGRAGEVYNVGGGDEATMTGVVALAERLAGREARARAPW